MLWMRTGDRGNGEMTLFPTCRAMERGPTVGRRKVDGHCEIELCPGGRRKSDSIRVEQFFSINTPHTHAETHTSQTCLWEQVFHLWLIGKPS